MASETPILDHVVVNARRSLDAAAELYRRLGFSLTEPSRHTLGSVNRTAVFDRDYLELVALDPEATAPRTELLRAPEGVEGLVFATANAVKLYDTLQARGLAVAPPVEFSRPVVLGDATEEARFRVVRVTEGIRFGRCYFCQHVTPKLVWRPEWRAHPNGVRAIRRVRIEARDPASLAALFERLLDAPAEKSADRAAFALGTACLEIAGASRDAIACLEFGVRSLDATRQIIAAAGLPARFEPQRILVPPLTGAGVLAFVEDRS